LYYLLFILSNYLVGISLVDKEALALPTKRHLGGVLRDERVEEGVELVHERALLRAQDATQALRLLAPRAAVAGDLDKDVGLGQVEAGVRHLAHEDCVHLGGRVGIKKPNQKNQPKKNKKKTPKTPLKMFFFGFFGFFGFFNFYENNTNFSLSDFL
jgi:hypothetical protein